MSPTKQRRGPSRQPQGGGGDDSASKTLQYRDFSDGMTRAGSRAGIPETGLWESINAQIIGPGEIATLTDPAASIVTLSPVATSVWGCILNLGGEVSRLIAVRSDGSTSAINPDSGVVTAIGGAASLSSAARVAIWRDTHVLFGDPAHGLASWDGTTFVQYPATFTATLTNGLSTITWTAGTPASALIPGMSIAGTGIPAGTTILSVVGTTITMSANATAGGSQTVTVGTATPTAILDLAVFEGRLWVKTSARGIAFTGPGSFTSFETVYAGGAAVFTDSVFPGQITRLISAMQLLWATSPGAVNTISNIQVSAGITTFQNENLVAGVGTPFTDSVQPLFRTLIFLTPGGVYAILGATPQKLSDALDGLFPGVGGAGTGPAAVFTLNNILVYAVMVLLNGVTRLLIYSRPTWLIGDQGDTLVWITTLVRTDGRIQAWGTDGAHVFQLFAGSTGSFSVRGKFFDYGAFTLVKTVRRVAVEADVTGLGQPDLQVGVENETGAEVLVGAAVPATVTWVNNSHVVVPWINNGSVTVVWVSSGHVVVKDEVRFSGNLLGFHLFGVDSVPLTIGAVAWEIGAAGEWTFTSP